MAKTPLSHFWDISNGKQDYTDTYNPNIIDNFYSQYQDTAQFASFVSSISNSISDKHHYNLYQSFIKKGVQRQTPSYIRGKIEE